MPDGPGPLVGACLPAAENMAPILENNADNISTLQRPLLMPRPFSGSRPNARWLRHTMEGHAPT